jgi:Spy/CpxP family protein refolding chaperone
VASFSSAQHDRDFQNKKGQIKAQKIAYISSQLNLTSEEAQKFWPVYNEYESQREAIKKEFRKEPDIHDINIDSLTDDEATKIADEQIILEQRLLDLQKKYYIKYKSVLPIKKIVLLFQAEKDFQRVLLQKIREQTHNNPRK